MRSCAPPSTGASDGVLPALDPYARGPPEYINATGDFTTAAYMLNDTVPTVLRRYQEFLDRDHQAKAQAFLRQALPPAAPPPPGRRSTG